MDARSMSCSILQALILEEDGPVAAEYTMMLVLIIVTLILAITSVGNSIADGWTVNVSKITIATAAS
jgi:Flp pilus assembly pilin Flp